MVIERYLLENKAGDRLDYKVYAITDTGEKIPMGFISNIKFDLDANQVLTKLTLETYSVDLNIVNVKSEIPMEIYNQVREEIGEQTFKTS